MTQPVEHPGGPELHVGEHPAEPHLPRPSIMPMVFGLGFMLVAFGIIFGEATAVPLGAFTLKYPLAWLGLLVILAAVGGWLWGNIRERIYGSETPIVAAKFAMWCFLGTEVIIFGALLARAVILNLQNPARYDVLLGVAASQGGLTPSLVLVSVNTFLLLVSSLMVVLGLDGIQHGDRRRLALFLVLTALLGAAFVSIQAYEYTRLVTLENFRISKGAYESAFYILTGNHGLHVIIGVIWSLVVAVRGLRGGFSAEDHMGVEIFGLYWHFVDVVWILIFTLVYLI